jgi:hypothetical protein
MWRIYNNMDSIRGGYTIIWIVCLEGVAQAQGRGRCGWEYLRGGGWIYL